MLFLGIDTATRVGSVGLVRVPLDGRVPSLVEPGRVADGCAVLAEVTRDTGLAHGAEILELVDACLAQAAVPIEAIACVAVSSGPGSFTGLRVALATAKGIALGGDVGLIGISTLEALATTAVAPCAAAGARTAAPGTVVAPCLDARKGEVYAAGFVVRDAAAWQQPNPWLERCSPDAAWKPDAFARELARWCGGTRSAVLLGDGPMRYRDHLDLPEDGHAAAWAFPEHAPRGAVVARLGAGLFAQGGPHDRATLVPTYARASEAEILRERRKGG